MIDRNVSQMDIGEGHRQVMPKGKRTVVHRRRYPPRKPRVCSHAVDNDPTKREAADGTIFLSSPNRWRPTETRLRLVREFWSPLLAIRPIIWTSCDLDRRLRRISSKRSRSTGRESDQPLVAGIIYKSPFLPTVISRPSTPQRWLRHRHTTIRLNDRRRPCIRLRPRRTRRTPIMAVAPGEAPGCLRPRMPTSPFAASEA